MRRGKNDVAAVAKFTVSGDPVAVKPPETVTQVGRKSAKSQAFPLPPVREKNQNLVRTAEGEPGGQEKERGRCFPPEKQLES